MKISFVILFFLIIFEIAYSQKHSIVIDCDSGDFIVEDSMGFKAGYDPILDETYRDLIFSEYYSWGRIYPDAKGCRIFPKKKMNYILTRIPTKKTTYKLAFKFQRSGIKYTTLSFIGVSDLDKRDTYKIYFDPDTTNPVWVNKVVTGKMLNWDLELCKELQLIENDSQYDLLKSLASELESQMMNKDISAAGNTLAKFREKIQNTGEENLSEDAIVILQADIEALQKKTEFKRIISDKLD